MTTLVFEAEAARQLEAIYQTNSIQAGWLSAPAVLRHLIENVTQLRARAEAGMGGGTAGGPASAPAVAERFALENELAGAAGRLMVAVEAYPELKADGTIAETQRTWAEVEAQITAARRFYNATAASLKNAVGIIPGSLLAAAAGVTELPFFETPLATQEAPDVDAILGRS